ncbi:hypothetical protein HYU15_01780, partial [Candidatus Woesearchaeota archaeon]|nr:hypothetical protein [Candidatus Woesearchaeota archaeon]
HPRTSNLVVETAGLFGEVSCYRALEELGYTFHKPNDTLGNRYYLSRLAIPNLERGGGFGRDAVRGTWVLAEREPGIIGAIDEGRLLTADELVRLALTAGNQNADGLKRSVDDYTLKPGLVTRSALNKLGSEKERSPLDTRIIRDPVYLAPS